MERRVDPSPEAQAWMDAWRAGMRRRGYPDARIILYGRSYYYCDGLQPPDPRYYLRKSCSDDAFAVFLSIEHLRPRSVHHRQLMRELLSPARA